MKVKNIVGVVSMIAALTFGSNAFATNVEQKTDMTNNVWQSKASEKVKGLILKGGFEVVDTKYIKSKLGKGTRASAKIILVDSRPAKKYAVGHVPASYSIPDTKFEKFYPQIADMDKSQEIVTYCGGWKCAKSPKVALMLKEKGWTNIKVYQEGKPAWKKSGNYFSVATLMVKSAVKKGNAVIIDARPAKKFAASHIPGSINIPDTKMDSMLDKFPKDKAQKIITYCGGYKCAKSHNVAKKLLSLGYTNVYVYSAGIPAWEKDGLPIEGKKANKSVEKKATDKAYIEKNGVQLVVEQDENKNMVYGPWYLEMIKNLPENIALVDVRDADDFAAGHYPGALNITFDEKKAKDFTDKVMAVGKTVILNCSAGATATEAMDAIINNGGDVNKIFFVDANMDCNKKNECTLEINEPL